MLSLVCSCPPASGLPFRQAFGATGSSENVTMTQHKLELPNPVQIREEINAAIPALEPTHHMARSQLFALPSYSTVSMGNDGLSESRRWLA